MISVAGPDRTTGPDGRAGRSDDAVADGAGFRRVTAGTRRARTFGRRLDRLGSKHPSLFPDEIKKGDAANARDVTDVRNIWFVDFSSTCLSRDDREAILSGQADDERVSPRTISSSIEQAGVRREQVGYDTLNSVDDLDEHLRPVPRPCKEVAKERRMPFVTLLTR